MTIGSGVRRALWLGSALLVGLLGGALWSLRGGGAELSAEALEAAAERWALKGPSSYVLDIETRGAFSDRKRVTVRDGEVTAMTTDGVDVPRASWEYWTVEGLLEFLRQEVAHAADPRPHFGVSDPSEVVLRARFDPDLGHPTFFLRHVIGQQKSVEWRILLER